MHSGERAAPWARSAIGAVAGRTADHGASGPEAPAVTAPTRRWLSPAAWAAAAMVLYAFLLQISYGGRIDSDGANSALQAYDLIHGDLLLRGWTFGDATFYAFELPVNGIAQLIFGLGPRAAHVASALVYLIIAACAVALAVTGARGTARVARAAGVVGIMAVPLLTIVTLWTLIEEPDHPGTSVFMLTTALLIDQVPGRLSGRRWVAPLVCVILAAGQLSDATILYVAVPAVILACGYRVLADRRIRSADAALVVAAAASVPLEMLVRAVMTRLGGYQEVAPKTALAAPGRWAHNAAVVVGVLRSLFGAVATPETRLGVVAAVLGTAGLLAAGAGVVRVLWKWRTSTRAEHLLVLFIALNLAVLVASRTPQADGYREIAAVLPCGAVLAVRAVVPASFRVGWLGLGAAATMGLIALVPLSVAASRPHVGPAFGPAPGNGLSGPTAPLTGWLEARHVTYALSGYWSSSVVTLQSSGKVAIRAIVMVPTADGGWAAHMPYWEVNTLWYDPGRHDARYVITEPHGEYSASGFEDAFGKPAATYRVAGIEVLEYRTNLLREILPSLGLGVGPK